MPPPPNLGTRIASAPRPVQRPVLAPEASDCRSRPHGTLGHGSACEVGGMSCAATSDTRATDSRITSSWGCQHLQFASLSSIRANLAMFATSSAGECPYRSLIVGPAHPMGCLLPAPAN